MVYLIFLDIKLFDGLNSNNLSLNKMGHRKKVKVIQNMNSTNLIQIQ